MQRTRSIRGSQAPSPENSEEEDAGLRSPSSPSGEALDDNTSAPNSAVRGRQGQRQSGLGVDAMDVNQ
jgi:hypothetical protein